MASVLSMSRSRRMGPIDLIDLGQADVVLQLEDDHASAIGRLHLPVPIEAVEDALERPEA